MMEKCEGKVARLIAEARDKLRCLASVEDRRIAVNLVCEAIEEQQKDIEELKRLANQGKEECEGMYPRMPRKGEL